MTAKISFCSLLAGAVGLLTAGCAVNTYHTSNGGDGAMIMNAAQKYNIVNGDTITIKADDSGQLPAIEFTLLSQALKNRNGASFGAVWNQTMPPLENAYGYLNIRSDDTSALKLTSRNANPILFDDAAGATPVQIKTVLILGPESYSAGWMTAYLLLVTMAPMEKYNCGVMVVSVLDQNGKTIGSQVVGLQHAQWVSCLFPTALFAGGDYDASAAGFAGLDPEEKQMQNRIIIQAATRILTGQADSFANPNWNNIRSAVAEALAVGNTAAAKKLLDTARGQNLGGAECQKLKQLF